MGRFCDTKTPDENHQGFDFKNSGYLREQLCV